MFALKSEMLGLVGGYSLRTYFIKKMYASNAYYVIR